MNKDELLKELEKTMKWKDEYVFAKNYEQAALMRDRAIDIEIKLEEINKIEKDKKD